MKFISGKNAGKTLEEVLLKKPDFARWYTEKYGSTAHAKEFVRLAKVFAAKSFVEKCHGCGNLATRASAYQGDSSLMFWCDECDMYSAGANAGKLQEIKTITHALDHIKHTASGNRALSRAIVKRLTEAKGLPKRVSADQATKFFK